MSLRVQPPDLGRVEGDIAGLVADGEYAPAWWVLGDAEGNEACVATWMGRD